MDDREIGKPRVYNRIDWQWMTLSSKPRVYNRIDWEWMRVVNLGVSQNWLTMTLRGKSKSVTGLALSSTDNEWPWEWYI